MSFELALLLGAIAFYLFDSAQLLYANELIFSVHGRQWRCLRGADLLVLRKHPVLPNPLLPFVPLFRVSWSATPRPVAPAPSPDPLPDFLAALRPLQYQIGLLGILLFGGLAWVARGHTGILLPLILLIYPAIMLVLLQVYLDRNRLGLSGKDCAKLAFDCLACPPFALNLIRKISLAKPLPGDPLAFAQTHFQAAEFHTLISAISHRLDEMLLFIEENTPKHAELQAYRTRLNTLEGCAK